MSDYEIGYRKPPKHTRFKKGQSGNPKGRPKGAANFVTQLNEELEQKIVVNENGKKKTLTKMQAMVKRMVAGALQGEVRPLLALVEILRRTGQLEEGVSNLLPEDYADILDDYTARKAPRKDPADKETRP